MDTFKITVSETKPVDPTFAHSVAMPVFQQKMEARVEIQVHGDCYGKINRIMNYLREQGFQEI